MAHNPQDAGLSAHELFLQGRPVNERLANLRNGQVPPSSHSKPTPPTIENADRELTTSERAALRELRLSEGWPVYQRLLEKIFRKYEKAAMTVSGVDPLRNAQEVVNAWAYLAMYRRARAEAETAMQQEVADEQGSED